MKVRAIPKSWVLVALLASMLYWQNVPTPPVFETVAECAYLLDASGELVSMDRSTARQRAESVEANRVVLKFLERGREACVGPCDTSSMPSLSALSELLGDAAESAVESERWAVACDLYLSSARVGIHFTNGSDWLAEQAGFGAERLAYHGIWQIMGQLNSDECADLAFRLIALDARRREPRAARIVRRCGEPTFLAKLLEPQEIPVSGNEQRSEMKADNRILALSLAIRSYELENERVPETLSDLLPWFLPIVPSDPFDEGSKLKLRRDSNGWVVYSVGPDRKDDGGRAKSLCEEWGEYWGGYQMGFHDRSLRGRGLVGDYMPSWKYAAFTSP